MFYQQAPPTVAEGHGGGDRRGTTQQSVSGMYEEMLKRYGHDRAEQEAKFTASLMVPAGQESSKVTINGEFDNMSAYENPNYANKSRKTNYHNVSHNNAAASLTENMGGGDREFEINKRKMEQSREEASLYAAVQPGNRLNSRVTGNAYAQQMMRDLNEKRERERADKQRRIAAERADEERVRNEQNELRLQVEKEIEKQKHRHRLVEERDNKSKMAYDERLRNGRETRQQQTLALQRRMENGFGNSTTDYFESRRSVETNPHKAKIQEMRELRWAREASGVANEKENNSTDKQYNFNAHRSHGGGRSSIDLSWG